MSNSEANSSDTSFAALAKSVEELSAKFSSEIARLEAQVALGSKIVAVEDKISFLDKLRENENKNFEKQMQLYAGLVEKAEAHRQETKRDIFKIITLGAAIAAACGIIGIPTIKAYLSNAVERQSERVSDVLNTNLHFAYQYTRGSALLNADNSTAALPYLRDCFKGHEYDESVLLPLLKALDTTDEWGQGRVVVDRLLSEKDKLNGLSDANTWNNLAAVETDVGVMYPEYFRYARDSLYRAKDRVVKEDKPTQRFILTNVWILSTLTKDERQARQAIKELLEINDNSIPLWERVARWKVFRVQFEADPQTLEKAGRMWKQLEESRHNKHPHDGDTGSYFTFSSVTGIVM